MLPVLWPVPPRSFPPAHRALALFGAPALALMLLANPAMAQTGAPESPPLATNPPPRAVYDNDKIDFAADEVEYDDSTDVVTARGNVFLRRGEQTVRASTVRWNRKTGSILAQGNLRVVDAEGNELLT